MGKQPKADEVSQRIVALLETKDVCTIAAAYQLYRTRAAKPVQYTSFCAWVRNHREFLEAQGVPASTLSYDSGHLIRGEPRMTSVRISLSIGTLADIVEVLDGLPESPSAGDAVGAIATLRYIVRRHARATSIEGAES